MAFFSHLKLASKDPPNSIIRAFIFTGPGPDPCPWPPACCLMVGPFLLRIQYLEAAMTAQNAMSNSSTDDLIKKQKQYLWPCVAPYYGKPLVLERGEGMHVWDADGNRYLDCFGGVLTVSVGHARPEVVDAISRQAAALSHTSTLYVSR